MAVVIPTGARVIDIDLDTTETNIFKNVPFNTNEMFYSTDIGMAFLKFTGTAQNYTGCTARLTLINFNDGSKVQRTFEMDTVTTFVYPMLETELAHAGRWIGQIAIIKNGTTISDNPFRFKIDGTILTAALISFDNINTFTSQLTTIYDGLNTFLDVVILDESERTDAEGLRVVAEGLRVTAEELRETADALRETKEGIRQATFEANEITRDGIVNSLVTAQTIAQKVAEKYQLIELTQANRLLTVEQQLEQTVSTANLAASKADAMASGAPKAVYGTLALLQAAYPTGTTGAYLVAADGNWYYWSGTAWTSGGLYQSRGIDSKSITKDDTSFIVTGKNRFDKKTVVAGYYVDWQTGNLIANVSYNVSDFVHIKDLSRITTNYHNSICFYGEAKNYLAGINGSGTTGSGYTIVPGEIVGQNAEGTYTRPANAVWARVTIDPSIVGRVQIESGETITPYQNYYVTVPDMEKVDDNVKNVIFKTTASQYDITFSKARYIFKRQTDATRALDTWRIYQGDVVDTDNKIVGNMFIDSDIEGAVKEVGVADFIGGYHGDETFSNITLLLDGKILDTSPATFNLKFKTLDIFVVSKMYHCATVNEAFDRIKHLHFEKEVLTVSNKLTVLSTFVVERAALGLFNCYKSYNSVPLITHYSENVGMSLKTMPDNLSDSNFETSVELDKVTLYGNGFTMHMNMEMTLPSTYQGMMTNFGSQNRIKVYFDVIKSVAGGTTLTAGSVVKSAFSIAVI